MKSNIKSTVSTLVKQNENKFYQSHLNCRVYFNAGLSQECFNEINEIVENLWLRKNHHFSLKLVEKKYILLQNIHLHSVFEILLRAYLIADIFVEIASKSISSKEQFSLFLQSINWFDVLPKNALFSLKVESFKSKLFHEKMMKDICSQVLKENFNFKLFHETTESESAKPSKIFIENIRNKLTVLLRLNKDPLYARDYKEMLAHCAPLREDIAHFCLQKLKLLIENLNLEKNVSIKFFLPFGGTGTFLFEMIQILFNLNPVLVRDFKDMSEYPFFPTKTVEFFKKKALEKIGGLNKIYDFIYLDNNKNIFDLFNRNLNQFSKYLDRLNSSLVPVLKISSLQEDFFTFRFEGIFNKKDFLLIPMNPPYGLRLNSKKNTFNFYKKICQKINELKKCGYKLMAGFILCPEEDIWSLVERELKHFTLETVHFMQGGLHIRSVFFCYKNGQSELTYT